MKSENTLLAFVKRPEEKEYLLFQTSLLENKCNFQWLDNLDIVVNLGSFSQLPIFCSLAFEKEELNLFAERFKKGEESFCLLLVGSVAEEEKAWQLCAGAYQEYFFYENPDKRLFYYLKQWLATQNEINFSRFASFLPLLPEACSPNLPELAYINLPEPLIILKKQNFELRRFNPVTLEFFNCRGEDELKNWFLPQLQNQIKENEHLFLEKALPSPKKWFPFSVNLEKPNGEKFSVWANLNQFYAEAETYLLVAFSDASRVKKEAEDALAQSEARFKAMVQNSSDVLAILAADSAFIFLSSSAEYVLGFQPEELIGTSFFAQVYQEDMFIAKSTFLDCLQTPKKLFRSEFRFVHSKGRTTYLDCLFVNYLDDSGLPGIILNIRDITQRKLAEIALAESEERLDLALWAANLAMWDLNLLTGKVFRNPRWEQLLELSAHEIEPTLEFWKRLIHPDDYNNTIAAFEMHLAGRIPFFQAEYRMQKKNGNWVWVLDSGKIVARSVSGKPQRVTGTVMDISERKLFEEDKKKQQAAILNALIEGQDQERKRMASELHDGLGQQLHAIKLHFNLLSDSLREKNFEETELITEIIDMITEAIQEIRNISHNLMPKSLQHFGLKVAIENLCEHLKKSQPFHIVLDTINVPSHLPPPLEASMYRIVQEALSNIIKHAKAQNVTIQLWIHNDVLSLMIEDDGVGFIASEAQKEKGLGLMNLETRVRLLNGVLTLDSYPNNGTTILIEIPIKPSGNGDS
jgi:PAS domain S-box-containing protein